MLRKSALSYYLNFNNFVVQKSSPSETALSPDGIKVTADFHFFILIFYQISNKSTIPHQCYTSNDQGVCTTSIMLSPESQASSSVFDNDQLSRVSLQKDLLRKTGSDSNILPDTTHTRSLFLAIISERTRLTAR